MFSELTLTVSELNQYAKGVLERDPVLRSVRLRGEISNFRCPLTGHWYFSLKDEEAVVSAVMYRSSNARISFRPTEGMRVIVTGSITIYPKTGSFQIVVSAMRPDGRGSLYQSFLELKEKLEAEGLFAASRKRPLPLRPRRIAVVTSRTGAVLQDIRRVSGARDASIPLVLLPVKVQGDGAAAEIAHAIRRAGTLPAVDVIIAGRGGGSMEDLWAFNE